MDKETVDALKGEFGKRADEIIKRIEASEAKGKEIEETIKSLRGAGEDFKNSYFRALNGGRPITPAAGESVEEFVARGVEETTTRAVVLGLKERHPDSVKRGLAGVTDYRGLSLMRQMRAMCVSWLRTGQRGIDLDVAAKFCNDELLDKHAAGQIEAFRDLMKDLEGSDTGKRESAKRALGSNIVGGGAAFSRPEQYAAFQDFLHPMLVMTKLGAAELPMPNGILKVPYLDTAATAAYRNQSVAANDSTPAEKILTFIAKQLGGQIVMTNELLFAASFAVEVFMRSHLARVMASLFDLKSLRGLGVADEIRGCDWWFDSSKNGMVSSSHKFNRTLSGGVATAKTIRADLLSMQQIVEEENIDLGQGKFGYAMTVREKYGLMRVTDTQDRLVFAPEMLGGTLMGAAFASTTQLPKTLAGDGAGSGTNNKSRMYGFDASTAVIPRTESPQVKFQDGAAYKDAAGNVQSGFSQNESALAIFEQHDFGFLYRGKEGVIRDSVDDGVAF